MTVNTDFDASRRTIAELTAYLAVKRQLRSSHAPVRG
jgi:hypothetical protein